MNLSDIREMVKQAEESSKKFDSNFMEVFDNNAVRFHYGQVCEAQRKKITYQVKSLLTASEK